jgi:hypothetical protein
MGDTLGTLFTCTTYGTWLRGDQCGWVTDGIVMPSDPVLEARDRELLKYEPFRFPKDDLLRVGQMIGDSLRQRLKCRILALTVQTWHMHLVVAATPHSVASVVKCAKEAVRWGLRLNRPLWTDGYDKRFCFDIETLRTRIAYVERHNLELGWPEKPWDFIESIATGT